MIDDPAVMKYYTRARSPCTGSAEPAELAATIAFLLSDDASYVTSATCWSTAASS